MSRFTKNAPDALQTVFLWILMAVSCSLHGCSDQASRPGLEIVHGTIHEIDVKHRTLALEFFVKQSSETTILRVSVPRNAEIMIGGAVSSLQAFRVGQTVMALGEVTSDRGQNSIAAIKVFLDDPKGPQRSPDPPKAS